VSVDNHFFDDLGADSMVMARFCARVRKRPDLPAVSMKDVYRHPTVRALAAALMTAPPSASAPAAADPPAHEDPVAPAGRAQYLLCGALQLLLFLASSGAAAYVLTTGYGWIFSSSGAIDIYLRSLAFGAAGFLGMCILPILVKWMLVGRWKHREIQVWSLAYLRFWIVKALIRTSPLVLFVGSPVYPLYLRALGARIGPGVAIFSRIVPVCTDLLTIGAGTVIRKDAHFSCYRAQAGVIRAGSVTIGEDVVVGEGAVIDIETSMGAGAQLGHVSSLHSAQVVPDGERWHGCPAQRTEADFRTVGAAPCGAVRRAGYGALQLLNALVLSLPLVIGGVAILLLEVPQLAALLDAGPVTFTSWSFYGEVLALSAVVFFGSLLTGLLVVVTVPRVLGLAVKADRVYPLYGLHYGIHRTIMRLTNVRFLMMLFGDSSAVVHYLRGLGYDLSRVEQTGSNFGTQVQHETPFLSSIGTGTIVADGLSMINADYSSTSFRLSRASIGASNFVGNHVVYPAQSRTGDNCLLATKVMVPVDGPVREGVGLLGAPAFEIPRSVERDSRFDIPSADERRRRVVAKNKHNTVTAALFLLVRWTRLFGITVIYSVAAELYHLYGPPVLAAATVVALLFGIGYALLAERASTGFRALRPLYCSIYDISFWRHERFWKLTSATEGKIFDGTPFKNVFSRLRGVRLGRLAFDDGCGIVEPTLVAIGDRCTLNHRAVIQSHSQEDGTFKSDRIRIGSGCTVGPNAWVHYGVTMGDRAVLATDSFLMKGEEMPDDARWAGNPAREMRRPQRRPESIPNGGRPR
jgi:non-ribosomal peptide synthetase-like protein